MDFQAAGDAALGVTALEQAKDVGFASGELYAGAFASLGASEDDAFGAFAGEGFLGALGNKVAFDFGGEPKRKGEDFGTDVGAEAVIVLDGPDLDFAFEVYGGKAFGAMAEISSVVRGMTERRGWRRSGQLDNRGFWRMFASGSGTGRDMRGIKSQVSQCGSAEVGSGYASRETVMMPMIACSCWLR